MVFFRIRQLAYLVLLYNDLRTLVFRLSFWGISLLSRRMLKKIKIFKSIIRSAHPFVNCSSCLSLENKISLFFMDHLCVSFTLEQNTNNIKQIPQLDL